MTLTERARTSLPIQTSLRRVPLRTKLVASVLVLVFAALSLISAASTYALHSYMITRLDSQLQTFAAAANELSWTEGLLLPPDYYVVETDVNGISGRSFKFLPAPRPEQLPPLVKGLDNISSRLDRPYTVKSIDGHSQWRMLITYLDRGVVLYVSQRLQGIDLAIGRLIWVDTLVGAGVLIALAAIGAAIVRQSLIPLVQIERTAAAIAAGDLTQRVPDPEPDVGEPRTELGRLSRALNAMLAQIEAAFTARAQSETAARAAVSDWARAVKAASIWASIAFSARDSRPSSVRGSSTSGSGSGTR